MTCEVFTWAALDDAHRSATRDYDREHVTPYLRRPGSPLRVRAFSATRRYPALRLSVDTAEDLEVVRRVWDELLNVGYGETATYGEIAHRLGKSNAASRAVGLANSQNPIPIVIACHRIIGANGTLTGYAGGLERKQILLGIEQEALF